MSRLSCSNIFLLSPSSLNSNPCESIQRVVSDLVTCVVAVTTDSVVLAIKFYIKDDFLAI